VKNKNNLWHLIWVIGMYAVLVAVFLLVIEYKVKWQNKDLNTYLYFYNCSGSLCTTNNEVTNYYSRTKCEKKICPYIKEKYGNYVILATNSKEYIFDYINEKIINESYSKYSFVEENVIFKNNENKYGVINLNNDILIDATYNKINDYKNGFLAYSENGKVGIINTEKNININPTYENVILIDENNYAYLEDGNYYIASYNTELPINNNTYDYVYSTNNTIVIIKDKKLDILNNKLQSQLLIKIDTEYEYKVEKERESLNLYTEGNLLHFTIDSKTNQVNYIYDLKNNKLFY